MATPPPPGIYVPVPTFFLTSASQPLDLSAQSSHALHLANSHITGLVLLGSMGEAVHLTNLERVTVVRHVRQSLERAGYNDYPLIAGTATHNVEDTVVQLTEAQGAGAKWGLVLAPGYFANCVTQDGVEAWYRAVADKSPLPIMVVSNNVTITPQTFAHLATHPNIVGCKLSHGDLSHHAQIASSPSVDHAAFATFTGLGQQLTSALTVGCAGAIDGLSGVFPRTMVHLFRLASSGENTREVRRLQYIVSTANEMIVKHGAVGIKEAVRRVLGFGARDGMRPPLAGGLPGGEAEWDTWRQAMGDVWMEENKLP
ncbi:MAG: hypothetical protein M1839_007716 [Geoglossum umbratile]|nr:MAG: hypothetical protein M1839_007716 [Geoglossum umbratile]